MNPEHNAFLNRTAPLLAVELQYYRLPRERWERFLASARQLGANAVSTYVMWGWHCPAPGVFDFSGATHPGRDLPGFIRLAQAMGFELILKPGPFIDAEVLGGGVPSWLLAQHPEMHALRADGQVWRHSDSDQPRCSYLHPLYQQHVREWFARFTDAALPFQWPVGPVISLQVDNETPGDGMIASDQSADFDPRLRGDYNPWVLGELWPRWLAQQYGSPAALAAAYATPIESFAAVEFPRQWQEPQALGEVRRWMDVARFEEHLHAGGVAAFAQMLRELGWQVPLFHDLLSMPWEASGVLTSMPALAAAVDWLGCNVYAEASEQPFVDYAGYAMDFPEYVHHAVWRPLLMKSYHPEFPAFIPEISSAGDFYFQSPFGGGLEAVSMYVAAQSDPEPDAVSGYPAWGMEAPLRADGSLRPRAWNFLSPALVLAAVSSVYGLGEYLAEVIIGYTHIPELAAKWAFRLRDARAGLPAGLRHFPAFQLDALSAAASQRIAQQLLRAHIQFGVTDIDACPLDNTPLLILPASPILARATQHKLAAFLQRGGRLVWLGGPLPGLDEHLQPCDLFARAAASLPGCLRLAEPPADWAALLGVLGAQTRFAWADHPEISVSTRQTPEGGLLLAFAHRGSGTFTGDIHLARPQGAALRRSGRDARSISAWDMGAEEPALHVRLAGPHVSFIALQQDRLHSALIHADQGGLVEYGGESIAVERGSLCAARFDDWLAITAPGGTRLVWTRQDAWPELQCWRLLLGGGLEPARCSALGRTLELSYATEINARETEAYLLGPVASPLPAGLRPILHTRLARARLGLERAAQLCEETAARLEEVRADWRAALQEAVPGLRAAAAGLGQAQSAPQLSPQDFLTALQAAAGDAGGQAYALLRLLRAVRAASAAGQLAAHQDWLLSAVGGIAGALNGSALWGEG